jgi:NAD(P)-dependent dehydrogenase (short-subunit alcohol dehydrogenase family)
VKGKDFCGQVVVVTGAASGIGRETARAFAGRGAELALADIDRAGLLDVEADLRRDGRRVLARAVDVSRAEEMERFANEVYGLLGRTDVLVNNAGIAINGFVEDMELTDWRRIVDVNVWGVIHGCHFFYPRMARAGRGHVVNVSSMAALGPLPASAAYGATKSAVLGLSEALRIEAARHGVGVSTICPGVVATGIGRTLKMVSGARGRSAEQARQAIGTMMQKHGVRPERVAAAIVRAVETNARIVPVGAEAFALDVLRRASRPLYDVVMRGTLRTILGR